MAAALLAGLLSLSGEPQCPYDAHSCIVSLMPRWSDDFADGGKRDLWCRTSTWITYDWCWARCPMKLVITDPPELRTWMCLTDNAFEPYSPDAHIDLYHGLNGKTLGVEAAGDASDPQSQYGCSPSDFSSNGNRSFAGKIALVRRGGCWFHTKARQAKAAGAAMAVVVDHSILYQFKLMTGSSGGIEDFPSLFAARHEADYILSAIASGVSVSGKFQYTCDGMPEGFLESPQTYPWDHCPDEEMAMHHTCAAPQPGAPQEPLCEVCPLEMHLPGGGSPLCLWGNDLLPRSADTLMHSWDLPLAVGAGEVVYATELPGGGCDAPDFASGSLAGKILLLPETDRCTLVSVVRHAQTVGVRAFIMVSATYYLQWYRIRGYSHKVHIPVHTVDYHAASRLRALAERGGAGSHIPGVGHTLGEVRFVRGSVGVPPAAAPQEVLPDASGVAGVPRDTSPDFEVSGGTAACIAIICIDVAALAILLVRARRDGRAPAGVQDAGFSLPLAAASTGLSVSLLLVVGAVSFALAALAGHEAVDTAMDDGRAALALSYGSASRNVVDLSDTVRRHVVSQVVALLRREVRTMEMHLKVAASVFATYDGSWDGFDGRTQTMWRMMRNFDDSPADVLTRVFTSRGFFLGDGFKTDDRPNSANRTVAEDNSGWDHGIAGWEYAPVSRGFTRMLSVPHYIYNASRQVAGSLGDPLAVTAGRPVGHTTWMPAKLSMPSMFHETHPISAFRPMYSTGGEHLGTLEVYTRLAGFINSALDTTALSQGSMQNTSVFVVDGTDKSILGSYNSGTGQSRAVGHVLNQNWDRVLGVYYMHQHPSVKVAALFNYLEGVQGWEGHAGMFDQKEYFSGQAYLTLMKVTASGGRAADVGVHSWDVEMRDGGCGACVAYDGQLQKEVLVFDGATTLHLYRNMTRRTPIVAQTQVSGPGELWRSGYEAFNENLTYSDGTVCVSHTWRLSATEAQTNCLLRTDLTTLKSYVVSMRVRPEKSYSETFPRSTTPRLFSDRLVGDANIRLFANGQLYLSVLRYGCRTKAYDGGFPVGVWTTVTAAVVNGNCSVYVNGTLHSTAIDSRSSHPRYHAHAHHVGQYFLGRVDDVQLFDYNMSVQEVRSLHAPGGTLVREVVSRNYFTHTQLFDMNEKDIIRDRSGLNWTVAVMIPREDIMRVVDADRRATLASVQVHEDNTHKKLVQKENATIMVIVALAVTSVIVFLVFNSFITQPVATFAREIVRVSQADVDDMTLDGNRSLVREINVMRHAINTLVHNMREYKTFMPEAIFSHEPAYDMHPQDAPGLQTGEAAVLFTDVQGSTHLWESCTDAMAEALRLHNTVIREVIAEHEGYEVKTIGDAFMVAFDELNLAVRFGLHAQERLFRAAWPADLLEVVQAPEDEAHGLRGLRVRMGLTYGSVNVEYNSVVRRCDYFGPTVNRAARLEGCGGCGGVVVDETCIASIAAVHLQHAVVVPLGIRTLKGIGDVPLSLLLPNSLSQRAAFIRDSADVPNPLRRLHSDTSDISPTSGSSIGASSYGTRLRAVDRFEERLFEVGSATVAHVDRNVGSIAGAHMTRYANDSLRQVVASLGRSDGRLLNVCGTAALVGWNVMAPCAGHIECSFRFASLCASETAVHCGLGCGTLHTGYVAAGKQRFVTAVGHCVQASLRAYMRAVDRDTVAMHCTTSKPTAAAMVQRGFASAAGEMQLGHCVFHVSEVLCQVVGKLLESKRGLFAGEAQAEPDGASTPWPVQS